MDKKVIFIMAGALVAALMVALLVSSKLSSKSGGSVSTTEILVAAKDLPVGTKLKKEDIKWKSWPDDSMYKGMYLKKEQPDLEKLKVYGEALRRSVAKGEPLTSVALVPDSKAGSSFLAAQMQPGMRAIGVKVTAETMAGGFITPGDYVDVILTYQVKISGNAKNYSDSVVQRYASEAVLENVRVLAVDLNAKEGDREGKVGKTVTLEVSQKGAEVLVLAKKIGDISLALRRLGDVDGGRDGKKITTDSNTLDVLQQINEIYAKSQVQSNNIRMYTTRDVSNIPVRASEPQPEGVK